ncbi:MAG: hypothetical protein KA052_01865 [Candidatus Pacebacteria bacterium]|nr:hypothetical protein [Candidatus Paceibacterota bacterium]
MNPETRTCEYCQTEFSITPGELTLYEKVELELPTTCIPCRFAQHFAFWPFGKFRKGTSALSGESLITMLPANARYPIYTAKEWWGDSWDAMAYGQDYDPSRSFFEQLKELQEKVPRPHQQGTNSSGSDWCDDVWDSKNCYLSRSIARAENLSYGYRVFETKDSFDISHAFNLDNCYECTYTFNSYNLSFSRNCRDCLDSAFLYDCRNCLNCTMCWNLRGKQYCIENVQYTKEEYYEKLKDFDMSSHANLEKLKERFNEILRTQTVHRENFTVNTYGSKGTYLANCNNCQNVFAWEDSENCVNCLRGRTSKDCIDLVGNWIMEVSGNSSCCTESYGIKYSSWSQARYSEYLDNCLEVEYCFGCVSLRKKKYCILNKQYTKEEYEALREKIVSDMRARGEYGKMLPYSLGLCDYNFTTAAIYMPEVTKEYVEERGGYWSDGVEDSVEGKLATELPDNISEVDAGIAKQPLVCPETGWRYNISPDEYTFLSRKKIALPRVHFDVRTKRRMHTIAPWRGNIRTCMYCEKSVTAYYPESWGYQKIACEDCYKREIN